MKKLMSLLLALALVISMAACGGNTDTSTKSSDSATSASEDTTASADATTESADDQTDSTESEATPVEVDDRKAADVYNEEVDWEAYHAKSEELYDANLGEFYDLYNEALEAENNSERWALMAKAEAKFMESSMLIPNTTQGGNFAITRVAPKTANSTLWGADSDRLHQLIVTTELIKAEDREALKAKWEELKGTGTYEAEAKKYLEEKGYTLTRDYSVAYSSAPQTWDVLGTYRAADTEYIVNTYDGLLEYDIENVQQPALAESYDVSEDGLTYTFHLRKGVKWVNYEGTEIAEVTADDFVAGLQHVLDAAEAGTGALVAGDAFTIVNADKYLDGEITDFSQVGVKAVDDYTLEYTLAEPCSYFLTIFGYNPFAPMNRAFYESKGGKFGIDAYAEALESEGYSYGKTYQDIAYNGPYLITAVNDNNSIVFSKNPTYWNKDNINLDTITFKYNDGSDSLKAYNDAVAGDIAGTGLNTEAVVKAREDKIFDDYAYISDTNATTYVGFLVIERNKYANFNDDKVAVSPMTVTDADRSNAAMKNVHFRHALTAAMDRGTINAQSVGEELKLNNVRNSYTPANFIALEEDVTIDINGTATDFAAGTYYGEIMQAQIDADGVDIKVWDEETGSGDGFDGWYNPEYAVAELELAIEELAAEGIEISEENPIYIDDPYNDASTIRQNQANALKQSVESVLGKKVIVNIVPTGDVDGWLYAGYYPDYGFDFNCSYNNVSGWGPDYGDPQTYLATLQPDVQGGMIKSCGIY